MQPDETPTKVIFRKYPDGDVVALFPALAGTMDPYTCSSYMLAGQHGAASVDIVQSTAPADEQDYRDTKQELERLGYNPLICTRFTRSDMQERIKQTKG